MILQLNVQFLLGPGFTEDLMLTTDTILAVLNIDTPKLHLALLTKKYRLSDYSSEKPTLGDQKWRRSRMSPARVQ
jgi:hypothetical protein